MQAYRTPARRQDPISCSLCRKKKLRCNRQNPCSNCIARNVPCEREGQLPVAPSQQDGFKTQDKAVIDRLQRLEEMVARLSENLPDHALRAQSLSESIVSSSDTPSVFSAIKSPVGSIPTPNEATHQADYRHLEDTCTKDETLIAWIADELQFKAVPAQEIVLSRSEVNLAGLRAEPNDRTLIKNQPRLILLPLREEALALFEVYVRYGSYLHHIIHIPTSRAIVEEIYEEIGHLGTPYQSVSFAKIGLMLSMIASAVSYQATTQADELSPIPPSQAQSASRYFTKATLDVLDHAKRIGHGTLEYVQAMTTTFFLIYNLEGFSARARIGFGDALTVARDIGLHRTDHEPDVPLNGISEVEKEIRRRVWWHVTASDWVLAVSGGPTEGVYNIHPSHIACHKPRNISDDEIATVPPSFSHPLSIPTDASYLIQRIRLATIGRQIVDAMPLNPSNPDAIPYSQLLELDKYFEDLFNELPYFLKLDAESQRRAKDIHAKYPHISMQKYMINMTANTRRCKLHQPFLLRGFTNPIYRHSRDVCLQSARMVLQIRKEMISELPLASGLLAQSGLYHHSFFAAIALVLDLCFNKTGGGSDTSGMTEEERKEEVWEICNMLKVARDTRASPVTERFLASLTQVLKKHKVRVERIDEAADRRTPGASDPKQQISSNIAPPTLPETTLPADDGLLPWQDHPLPDFDGVIQDYIDLGPGFNVTEWEDLFTELEPQFNM